MTRAQHPDDQGHVDPPAGLPPRGRVLGAELTGYADTGRRKLRVDIVDRNRRILVASMSTGQALSLAGELISAVARAREDRP